MTLDSPANIEFLLWFHTRCTPHPQQHTEVGAEIITRMLNGEIIRKVEDHYETTPKGQAWVKLLCDTPEPQTAFVDRHGVVIV